ncbi:MAG: hypothetical protein IPJ68_03275 [Candidatus Moraniibacteriota bacterium]|nr:MAG: hypothetical protein IPJ68_03275 [Candidatus Moranbacteria bacterium]
MLSVDNVDAQTKYERVYTRENCLLAFQVWEEHQTKTIAELLNWADRPILFDAHEGVAHVYYHELTFIDYEANIIKKTLRDSGFITKTMHWYGEILDYLEPVWKVGRPLQSREKLLEFYERALDAWCGLDISYVVPLMDQASVDDKRLAMSMRERASDFLEEIDHVFQRTLGVLYPELGDLVKYIRIEEVRGDDMFPTITALKNRKRHFLYYDREIYTDRTLIQFLKSAHIEITEDCVSPGSDTGTLKGQTATRGKIQGRARILHRKADILLIQAGEILITAMTTPDYVPAMQRAAAFVTDEGGITCHAAIIAREMKKPCIIGTKIATQVLHDGDLVEVDADHGVVRVIQRASL